MGGSFEGWDCMLGTAGTLGVTMLWPSRLPFGGRAEVRNCSTSEVVNPVGLVLQSALQTRQDRLIRRSNPPCRAVYWFAPRWLPGMAGPSSVPSTVRAPIHESRRRSSRGCGLRSRATAAIFTSMGEYSAGMLDRVFSAVSDARVTDVASAFPISLNSTSKHIRVLEGAGLVRRRVRGREHILSLDAAPLAEAAGWIEHYRRFWSDQLASLDAFVTGRDNAERSS